MQHRWLYVLFQYRPSAVSDEFIYLGLLVWNEDGDLRFQWRDNWERLSALFPDSDILRLRAVGDHIKDQLNSNVPRSELLKPFIGAPCDVVVTHEKVVIMPDIDKTADWLRREYLLHS